MARQRLFTNARPQEETACDHCGCPLHVGDPACETPAGFVVCCPAHGARIDASESDTIHHGRVAFCRE